MKEINKKAQLVGAISGLISFFTFRFVGITPFIPLTLIFLSFLIIILIDNKTQKIESEKVDFNPITFWRFMSASILIGHALWAAIAFIMLVGRGMSLFEPEFVMGSFMVISYFVLSGFIIKNRRPRISCALSIICALIFMALNLTSLAELRYQAFASIIYLHSIIRIIYVISAIRLMWLLDVDHRKKQYEKNSDDSFYVA
ncbi:hypothetical protein M902_3017 [Bacteriovorax sp. BAL6_X]|uniref:hypothetical protein n=1 Tax=Bacteriovorax sp. BAL6_X TaxID=1201290 RepID=UPI00038644C0|nr:hypothetical protein [Bacteriovorax sp. BAL6_X]EPZ51209.1 hypothetical protein M902_3017 [Bacteriovorax sp. BAL6_X]